MYWIDVTAAVKLYLDERWPQPGPEPAQDLLWEELTNILASTTKIMTRLEAKFPDRAFWHTVPTGRFVKHRRALASVPSYQDPGRALLLAWGYNRLGGIAPFLLPWLAPLAMLPILAWAIVELWAAGFPAAATVLASLVPSSLYLIQCLAWGHSACQPRA